MSRKSGNFQEQISQEILKLFPLILLCEVVYICICISMVGCSIWN